MTVRKRTVVLLAVIGVFIAGTLGLLGPRGEATSSRTRVVLAISSDPSSGPIFIAYQKGFFRSEGLDVSLRQYSSGKKALEVMESGSADFATIADTVLMFAAMKGDDVCAIATISDSNGHHRVIARPDLGIRTPFDLAGKRIGVTIGTTGEFFLYSFLLSNGIEPDTIRTVDLTPEEMNQALADGRVDAVATWYPTVALILSRSDKPTVVFADTTYSMNWNIVTRSKFPSEQEETVKKLIRSLLRGQKYIIERPKESIPIIAQFAGIDLATFGIIWSDYNYDIRLGGSLLINLEDQARWAISLKKTARSSAPDFTRFICSTPLRQVDEQLVTISGPQENK